MSATDTGGRVSRFGSAVAEGWTRERFGLLGAVALVTIAFGPPFQVYLFTDFLVVALFALGFNLLYGYTGLLSFGHGLFYAGGAYGIAIVLRDLGPVIADVVGAGISPLVTFVGGGVVGLALVVVVALPVGWLSVRLEEIYFALITLAFGMLGYSLIIQDPAGLTNGTDGIIVLLGTVDLGGASVPVGGRRVYYVISAVTVVTATYGVWRVVNSPFGTVCKAIRESPDRAAALGIDVRHHRWMTFILSAMIVGVAGVLRAGLASVASPGLTHWSTSAIAVIATVIGGATYFSGPIVGAFVFLYIRWAISRFPTLEAYWELFFGALLIAVVLFFKQGAVGGLHLLRDRLVGDGGAGGSDRGGSGALNANANPTASDGAAESGDDNAQTDGGDAS
ncbi:branched-chain amino acid ABC transporter permease [Halorubrum sp. ARQ200]|jgi:branched-chain amino acid transport system permease protein|uniref:branched-chain amino acid ABC transporter permease n=1 Tax=Halorubrum sp. ARQ200 TaxID=1855872 RepID=UPI0010F56B7E|nr:branched-chain amino acid ABC transporter permease [Halorubrum sp. ARQ200]TKX42816.1 branched-chain amino acid ABC transporter permease [Halorubrum sp. ARQ200]